METPNTKTNEIAEAQVGYDAGLKVALAAQNVRRTEDGLPFIIVQSGLSIQTVETTLKAPTSRRGNILVTSVQSFIELVKREYNDKTTVIFAFLPNSEPGSIVAIVDYHSESAEPSWCEYRITLQLSHTAEWIEWKRVLGVATRQIDLAEFLEERYIDVHSTPDGVTGATILEIALSLQAKKGVTFRSEQRLQNGDSLLQYEETTTARAGQKGELEIPKEFTLMLPVYEGFQAAAIRVLLRYRINEGVLSFICKPVNIERTLIAIREAVIEQIKEETELPVYLGSAISVPARKIQ
jgi:uncharacterized protein YfdQ (DUF2303 family)